MPIKRRKHSLPSRWKIWMRTRLALRRATYGQTLLRAFEARLGGEMPSFGSVDDLVLVACDDVYFHKFGLALLASMRSGRDQPALHIHLLGPSRDTVCHLERLRKTDRHLTFTIDDCSSAGPPENIDFYYTSARFILAPLLLKRGIKRLLIIDIDIDSVMRQTPWPLLDKIPESASMGFVFRPDLRRHWKKVLANAVFYRGDPIASLFADRFARALLKNLAQVQEYHIDQIIPFYLLQTDGVRPARGIARLSPTINALDYDENAAFWTAKGADKNSDMFRATQTAVSA